MKGEEKIETSGRIVYNIVANLLEGELAMINSDMGTQHFKTISENPQDAQTILLCVYHALSAKGYDPITQIVGYLISGDPTYITSYQNARSLICRIDRDELLEELVQFYLSKNV